MPNKLLGQNFLKNPVIIKKIAGALDISSGDIIFEIGPGHGELTRELRPVAGERDVRIIAIEKDKKLIPALEKEFQSNVEIISGDALKELPSVIQKLKLPNQGFKIVGNIPYYLTGHLLRIISELDQQPSRCVFLIQKEVAERIVAVPPDMNRLAASVQFWSEPKIITRVPRKDFFPQPKVDSAVLVLEKRREPIISDSEKYYAAIRAVFAQPRKTVLNNVTAGVDGVTKEDVIKTLLALEITPTSRPQDLSLAQIGKITSLYF